MSKLIKWFEAATALVKALPSLTINPSASVPVSVLNIWAAAVANWESWTSSLNKGVVVPIPTLPALNQELFDPAMFVPVNLIKAEDVEVAPNNKSSVVLPG